jgi:hypothetical protein
MVTMRMPSGITQHAIGAIVNTTIENLHAPAFIPYKLRKSTMQCEQIMALDHYCNAVVHPVTGERITKYEKLANDPVTREVWTKAMSKELGRLAQGFDGTEGTSTFFFMTKDEIKTIKIF